MIAVPRSALLLVETVEGLSAATLLILQAGKITLTHRTEVLGSYACFPCFLPINNWLIVNQDMSNFFVLFSLLHMFLNNKFYQHNNVYVN